MKHVFTRMPASSPIEGAREGFEHITEDVGGCSETFYLKKLSKTQQIA